MTQRAVGTWFYEQSGDSRFDLYQEWDDGPHCVGEINNEASASYICEKLNEMPRANAETEQS